MRSQILALVQAIPPIDELEAEHQKVTTEWIQSGRGLFRTQKPATPDPHLVSYFVLFDPHAKKILLVDHKDAQLWLPSGGHVEPNEHPKLTVSREAAEELGINADFFFDEPVFITVTETVGRTAGHTDISLWYLLKADSSLSLSFDEKEFFGINWFAFEDIPFDQGDPHLRRFIVKLKNLLKN